MIHKKLKNRIVSVMLSLLILLPILILTAYASSPKKSYSYSFNGLSGTSYTSAKKTDVGDSTGRAAGISILGGDFGYGQVRFWINGPRGDTITDKTQYYSGPQSSISLIYSNDNGLYDNCNVTMYCQASIGVQYVYGNFQP